MIRTPDLLVPNQALYQTEPHPDYLKFHALRALPVVTKPLSSSQQRLANRQVTATPFCSFHPPPAALANVPKLSLGQKYSRVLAFPLNAPYFFPCRSRFIAYQARSCSKHPDYLKFHALRALPVVTKPDSNYCRNHNCTRILYHDCGNLSTTFTLFLRRFSLLFQ